MLRCDNGPELACAAMADWAGQRVGLSFIPPGGHCPALYAWFVDAGGRVQLKPFDVALQCNALMKAVTVTGVAADRLRDRDFDAARDAIVGMPSSGRNMSAIFTRLRITLFHCGQLAQPKRAALKAPIIITGWADAPLRFADTARRYLAQVELSLRLHTVKGISQALREFGAWLGHNRPEVNSCADLTRSDIEDYKSWLGARHGRYTGKPLNRVTIKNRLINLHCFFDRDHRMGLPQPAATAADLHRRPADHRQAATQISTTPQPPSSCAPAALTPTRYRG